MSNEALNLINQARAQARADGVITFFINNGKILFRLILVLLAVAVIFVGYNSYTKSNEEKFSTILHQSLVYQQTGEFDKSVANLREIVESSSAPAGVKSLASLRYAAFLLEEGKKEDAANVYLQVSECGSCDEYIRDLCGLLAVRVWLSNDVQLQKPDLVEKIEKVENRAGILRYHVAEQRALLELQKNNLEKSYQIFEMIAKNPEASQTLKARATEGMALVVSKGFEPKV